MHWSFYGGYRYLKTAIKAPSDSNFFSSLHCFQTLTLPVTLLSASVNTHLQSVPWEPGHTTSDAVANALGMVNIACSSTPLPPSRGTVKTTLPVGLVTWPVLANGMCCMSQPEYKGMWFSSLFSLLQGLLCWDDGAERNGLDQSHWKESCPRELSHL